MLVAVVVFGVCGCRDVAWERGRPPMAVATHDGRPVVAYAGGPVTIVVEPSTVMQVGDRITCMAPHPDEGFLVFCTDSVIHLRHRHGVWGSSSFSPIEHTVRAARRLGNGTMALLTGGSRSNATPENAEPPPWLLGGQIRPARLDAGRIAVGEAKPGADANPFRVKAGRFAGEDDNLLVFVYTRAPFDNVMRRRPWVYRLTEGDDGLPRLEPRWRGTSFAHPFRDATFGDFTGEGRGEIAALEVARDGGRLLTLYHFEGFGLEGLARSLRLPAVEDRIEAIDTDGDGCDEPILRRSDGRFIRFELERGAEELREAPAIDGPADVRAWTVVRSADEFVCALSGGRILRIDPLEHMPSGVDGQ